MEFSSGKSKMEVVSSSGCGSNKRSSSSDGNVESSSTQKKPRGTATSATTLDVLLSTGSEQDALTPIVGFSTHAERWNLAKTCQGMYRLVETYCERALSQISKDHKADDEFMARLRATRQQQNQGNLPFRYLLEVAKNTYLYTLDMMHIMPNRILGCFALLGERGGHRRLLTLAATEVPECSIGTQNTKKCPPVCLYLWDLAETNKRPTWRVEIPSVEPEEFEIKGVFFMNENQHIVTCTSRRVLVCSAVTGELIHSYSKSRNIEAVATRDATTVVFSDYHTRYDEQSKLHSFNIVTGESQELTQMTVPYPADMHICNNRWMVLEGSVFDMENDFRQIGPFPGMHDFEHYGSNTFYGYSDYHESLRSCYVNSDTGEVSLGTSLDLATGYGQSYRGKVGDGVFVETNRWNSESPPTLQVKDINNGMVKRTMRLPAKTKQSLINYMVSSNGFELFVGVEPNVDRLESNPEGPKAIIAVYLAGEHY